jgi:hypothetical protein
MAASAVAKTSHMATIAGSLQTAKVALFETANDTNVGRQFEMMIVDT